MQPKKRGTWQPNHEMTLFNMHKTQRFRSSQLQITFRGYKMQSKVVSTQPRAAASQSFDVNTRLIHASPYPWATGPLCVSHCYTKQPQQRTKQYRITLAPTAIRQDN